MRRRLKIFDADDDRLGIQMFEESVPQFSYAPSPAEIREACLEIQMSWSPQERRRRCIQGVDQRITVQTVRCELRSA